MDDFDDDDFFELPDNALQELENNAIQFTQAVRAAPPTVVDLTGDYDFEDDDLDDSEVTNDRLVPVARPLLDKSLPQQPRPSYPAQQWSHGVSNTAQSRYPPASVPALHQQQPQHYSNIGVRSQQNKQFVHPPPRQQHPHNGASQLPSSTAAAAAAAPPGSTNALVALQQRVKALEAELNAARGEAAILRSNTTRAHQAHDAEVARLKKQNAEALARHERRVEQAVAAEKTAATELQFLQQDMKEVSTRVKKKDTVPGGGGQGAATPKKTAKTWGIADGFDDLDLVASPSKVQGRSRAAGGASLAERTPTKNKRKRTVDSPAMALETHTDDVFMADRETTPTPALPMLVAEPRVTRALPFEFLQLVLDHASNLSNIPTFDVLSRLSYPSEPKISLSAMIFQKLPTMGDPKNPTQLLIDFSQFLLQLWKRCYDEKYLAPIKDLCALLVFVFQLQVMPIVPPLISYLLPITQDTIYLIADRRYRSPNGVIGGDAEANAIVENIDSTAVLSLIYTAALVCATTVERSDVSTSMRMDFWRLMAMDTVQLLLTPKQRLDDILGMLRLLCTSVFPTSIGPINESKDPVMVARIIIEKSSRLLVDFPRWAISWQQKHALRSAALETLTAFMYSALGATQLALHPNLVPRLVTVLSSSIDELYELNAPELGNAQAGSGGAMSSPGTASDGDDNEENNSDDGQGQEYGTGQDTGGANRIIAQVMFLLHGLVTGTATTDLVAVNEKLSTAHGGSQRYILALARLNFAGDVVLEEGIDEETVELAHELLELAVTPDEAEAISEVFGVEDG